VKAPAGTVLVNSGLYGEALAEFFGASMEDETFVAARTGEPGPSDAEILVTLLEDPATIPPLLTPSVRWVHVLGAGVDGFPFEAVGDRTLTCSRGAASTAISEWVLAVMLAFEKQIPQSFVVSPPEKWNVAALGGLEGRTLGLVGLGAIGEAIAIRALAFEMTVLGLRRRDLPAPHTAIEMVGSLEDLLARADHVVIAAPATTGTRHLVGAEAFKKCKPGLHLVNVARGSLVDQEALRTALDDGRVACASLDTVDPEPLDADHWMYEHPRVRLSPHISWSSPQTMSRTMDLFASNLARYRDGEALLGLVDPVAGY
jgi:phosphoglycerate dehydrogenase-like enzyme